LAGVSAPHQASLPSLDVLSSVIVGGRVALTVRRPAFLDLAGVAPQNDICSYFNVVEYIS
jgi:hypothetical protein